MRISYTFLDGPLKGRTVPHANCPEDIAAPVLYRMTTGPKDGGIDRRAQGLYHIERRKLPPLSRPLLKGEPLPEEFEYVAIHHPSTQDAEFHELVPEKQIEAREVSPTITITAGEPPPGAVILPDDHPMVKRLRHRLAPLAALLKKEQE